MLLYMDRYMYIYRYLSKYNVYRYLIPPTCVFVPKLQIWFIGLENITLYAYLCNIFSRRNS